MWITFDEAPTKTCGLPNISFIKRKFKPLGTEGKTACDCATGIMIHFEIQEGRDAMRLKEHAPELDVAAACTMRMAERSAPAGATLLGDSWTERVLADITKEPPSLPNNIMHLDKRHGNDNTTKQARCTMCRVEDDNVGWTSYNALAGTDGVKLVQRATTS
eukprot:jgi/Tetstr1/439541/TSEL_027970.t1